MSVLTELYSCDKMTIDVMPSLSGIYVARISITERDFQRQFLVCMLLTGFCSLDENVLATDSVPAAVVKCWTFLREFAFQKVFNR